ncbi:unnamed protein product [Sphenostylis stenocarpa]|uniref:Uncharacterized protein n=1 Tax=Sphenostylis stenocarpa TaxID=92480 RepID=A0AA86VKI2_9FABA|nr:unnamed protein product [Sphenostylis stenocarpa]
MSFWWIEGPMHGVDLFLFGCVQDENENSHYKISTTRTALQGISKLRSKDRNILYSMPEQ